MKFAAPEDRNIKTLTVSRLPVLAVTFVILFASCGHARPSPQQEVPPAASSKQEPAQPATASEPLDFTDEVVRSVLGKLQEGMQNHRLDQTMAVFDPAVTTDYPTLKDQFGAFLARYEGIEFRYKILQETSEKDSGYVICDIDMDALPTSDNQMPIRRGVQMRFHLKRGAGGEWKVVAFRPADFFTR